MASLNPTTQASSPVLRSPANALFPGAVNSQQQTVAGRGILRARPNNGVPVSHGDHMDDLYVQQHNTGSGNRYAGHDGAGSLEVTDIDDEGYDSDLQRGPSSKESLASNSGVTVDLKSPGGGVGAKKTPPQASNGSPASKTSIVGRSLVDLDNESFEESGFKRRGPSLSQRMPSFSTMAVDDVDSTTPAPPPKPLGVAAGSSSRGLPNYALSYNGGQAAQPAGSSGLLRTGSFRSTGAANVRPLDGSAGSTSSTATSVYSTSGVTFVGGMSPSFLGPSQQQLPPGSTGPQSIVLVTPQVTPGGVPLKGGASGSTSDNGSAPSLGDAAFGAYVVDGVETEQRHHSGSSMSSKKESLKTDTTASMASSRPGTGRAASPRGAGVDAANGKSTNNDNKSNTTSVHHDLGDDELDADGNAKNEEDLWMPYSQRTLRFVDAKHESDYVATVNSAPMIPSIMGYAAALLEVFQLFLFGGTPSGSYFFDFYFLIVFAALHFIGSTVSLIYWRVCTARGQSVSPAFVEWVWLFCIVGWVLASGATDYNSYNDICTKGTNWKPRRNNATCDGYLDGFGFSSLSLFFIAAPRFVFMVPMFFLNLTCRFAVRFSLYTIVFTTMDGYFMLVAALVIFILHGLEEASRNRFRKKQLVEQKIRQSQKTRDLANRMLDCMLPAGIVDRLYKLETVFDRNPASVVISDVAGFTSWCAPRPPLETVKMLNQMYRKFDQYLEAYEMDKVTTVGDSYWAACGIPILRQEHAAKSVAFARRMHQCVELMTHDSQSYKLLRIRVGVHSGLVEGGVLGTNQIAYQVFGGVVDIAEALQSRAPVGGTLISEATLHLLRLTLDDEDLPIVLEGPRFHDPTQHALYNRLGADTGGGSSRSVTSNFYSPKSFHGSHHENTEDFDSMISTYSVESFPWEPAGAFLQEIPIVDDEDADEGPNLFGRDDRRMSVSISIYDEGSAMGSPRRPSPRGHTPIGPYDRQFESVSSYRAASARRSSLQSFSRPGSVVRAFRSGSMNDRSPNATPGQAYSAVDDTMIKRQRELLLGEASVKPPSTFAKIEEVDSEDEDALISPTNGSEGSPKNNSNNTSGELSPSHNNSDNSNATSGSVASPTTHDASSQKRLLNDGDGQPTEDASPTAASNPRREGGGRNRSRSVGNKGKPTKDKKKDKKKKKKGGAAEGTTTVDVEAVAPSRWLTAKDFDDMRSQWSQRRDIIRLTFLNPTVESRYAEYSRRVFISPMRRTAVVIAMFAAALLIGMGIENNGSQSPVAYALPATVVAAGLAIGLFQSRLPPVVGFPYPYFVTLLLFAAAYVADPSVLSTDIVYVASLTGLLHTALGSPGISWLWVLLCHSIFYLVTLFVMLALRGKLTADIGVEFCVQSAIIWFVGIPRYEVQVRAECIDELVAERAIAEVKKEVHNIEKILSRTIPSFVLPEITRWMALENRSSKIVAHKYDFIGIMFCSIPSLLGKLEADKSNSEQGGSLSTSRGPSSAASNSTYGSRASSRLTIQTTNLSEDPAMKSFTTTSDIIKRIDECVARYPSCTKIKNIGLTVMIACGLDIGYRQARAKARRAPTSKAAEMKSKTDNAHTVTPIAFNNKGSTNMGNHKSSFTDDGPTSVSQSPSLSPRATTGASSAINNNGSHGATNSALGGSSSPSTIEGDTEDSADGHASTVNQLTPMSSAPDIPDADSEEIAKVTSQFAELYLLASSLYTSIMETCGCHSSIGMHCGPIVGGVIGDDKLIYDLFGDTVNTASRVMTTSGEGVWLSDMMAKRCMRVNRSIAETDGIGRQRRSSTDPSSAGLVTPLSSGVLNAAIQRTTSVADVTAVENNTNNNSDTVGSSTTANAEESGVANGQQQGGGVTAASAKMPFRLGPPRTRVMKGKGEMDVYPLLLNSGWA